jgi:hypothetical protein
MDECAWQSLALPAISELEAILCFSILSDIGELWYLVDEKLLVIWK